jgi:geranylgeranyl pyrophosphate synthase
MAGITINPHEIEDFYAVTDKYGTRWQIDDDVPDILED